jgi:hypothetical protein
MLPAEGRAERTRFARFSTSDFDLNGLRASVSEQRVVNRLGFLLTDPCQYDLLQSWPACGKRMLLNRLKGPDFIAPLGSVVRRR